MLDGGVSTRRGIMCSHREPAYADCSVRHPLRHSEEAQDRCVILPLYGAMTAADITTVISTLRAACVRAAA
jgi:dTDP-4-amino-4,6-dideoxygalactose transaminase